MKKNICDMEKNDLCNGCGGCVSVCPYNSVSLYTNKRLGCIVPRVNQETCKMCGLCTKVCSGIGITKKKYQDLFLDGDNQDDLLGKYIDIKIGNSADLEIRKKGASGGVVTTILIYMLENGFIEGAIVTRSDQNDPLKSFSYVATRREMLLVSQGSIYTQSSPNAVLKDVLSMDGKYAFVGLPCQVQSLRKLQRLDKRYQEKIPYVLGLFCANVNTEYSIKYYLSSKRIKNDNVKKISYRHGGWPGKIHIETSDKIYDFERGKGIAFKNAFQGKFMVPRCLTCDDLTNELADVSLGDPHVDEIKRKEKIGISWFIVRSSSMLSIIQEMQKKGYLNIDDYSLEKAKKSNNFSTKKISSVDSRRIWLKNRGRAIPRYGRNIKAQQNRDDSMNNYVWSFLPYNYVKKLYLIFLMLKDTLRGE